MHTAVLEDIRSVQTGLRRSIPRRRIGPESSARRLGEGQHLFYEADPARFVFRVTSGVLRLTRTQKDGRRQVIAFAFPGDIVGLPSEGRYTTECDAIVPAEVEGHRCELVDGAECDPRLQSLLMASALNEIRLLQDHFLILGRRLASEKVASFLLLLLDRIGEPLGEYFLLRLPMKRSDVADYLGLTPETVSRSITQFRAARIIALEDANTIVVRSPERLRALAEGD